MLFTSPGFYLFLAIVLAVFALLPATLRIVWLMLASLFFYGVATPWNLAFLGGVMAGGFICTWLAERAATDRAAKGWLTFGALGLIGALVVLKFYDATATALGLPQLGITAPAGYSFYTFMVVAHLIDLGRGSITPPSLAGYLLYVSWFPKIFAGPIERSATFVPQLAQGLRLHPGMALLGFSLVLAGLIKKLVIADNLAPVVDAAFAIPAYAPPMELLIAAYFFAFQIYCDFAGYSDIAIGLSALFGLQLRDNFRRPYLSRSIGEFWAERWHITLGNWFRDYLYFPLGGSRRGGVRKIANLMCVFAISGLWHAGLGYGVGWGFLIWGLLNGVFVSVENLLALGAGKAPPGRGHWLSVILQTLLTFHLIGLAWVFFRAATISDALTILRRIAAALPSLPGLLPVYPFSADHALGATLVLGLMAIELAAGRQPLPARLLTWPRPVRWGVWYGGLALLLVFGRWQGGSFIYMQF
ncbi:MAG: MBOAT family O-acyltransferase [Pseudorhodobacter sp.]|nr:MBOAT family O-acyltransferase [Pseudorhodobacter sp.]